MRDKHERKHRQTARHHETTAMMAGADFDAVPSLAAAMGTRRCIHGSTFPCAQCTENRSWNEAATKEKLTDMEFEERYCEPERTGGMSKHTPGPWSSEMAKNPMNDVFSGYWLVNGPNKAGVADLFGEVRGGKDENGDDKYLPGEEIAANARLIAAAPDLKHACLAALGFLGGVSILSKEQLQTLLADTLKKAGVNQKWSSG